MSCGVCRRLLLLVGIIARSSNSSASVTSLTTHAVVGWARDRACFRSLGAIPVGGLLAKQSEALLAVSASVVVTRAWTESLLFLVVADE